MALPDGDYQAADTLILATDISDEEGSPSSLVCQRKDVSLTDHGL